MTWYNKYKDITFKAWGDDIETGIDCFNFMCYILKVERGIVVPYKTYQFVPDILLITKWYNKTIYSPFDLMEKVGWGWEKVSSPKIYDILTFNYGATNCANHCAMYVDTNKLLQIMENKNSWVGAYGSYSKQYNNGRIYRWNENLLNLEMIWDAISNRNTHEKRVG